MKATARFRSALTACALLVLTLAACHPNDDDVAPQPPITSPVDSSTVAMDTAHWIYFGGSNYAYYNPTPGLFEFTSEGVKAYPQQARTSGFLLSKYAYDMRNRTIKLAWKVNDGGQFSDYVISIADSTAVVWDGNTNTRNFNDLNYVTTRQPYNGSVVVSNNVWYYTTITTTASNTYTLKTAFGNYADSSGVVFETRTGNFNYNRGRIALRAGDPYAGSANSFVIHELSIR